MHLYMVAYQSADLQSTYSAVTEIGEVYSLMDGVCLMKTTLNTIEVRDYIRERGSASKVFVTTLAHGAAWTNVNSNSQTIKDLYSEL